jgi:hypothetical protein
MSADNLQSVIAQSNGITRGKWNSLMVVDFVLSFVFLFRRLQDVKWLYCKQKLAKEFICFCLSKILNWGMGKMYTVHAN